MFFYFLSVVIFFIIFYIIHSRIAILNENDIFKMNKELSVYLNSIIDDTINSYISVQIAKDKKRNNMIMTNKIFENHKKKIYELFISSCDKKFYKLILNHYTTEQLNYFITKKLELYIFNTYYFKNKNFEIDNTFMEE